MAEWIEKRFDKVDDKLEKIDTSLGEISEIQVAQAKDIAYHIARTDTLQNALSPISKDHQQLMGILKFIAFLVTLGGLLKLVEYLKV